MNATSLKERLIATVQTQKGVLFGEPAIVYRKMYTGRDIIAKNSRFTPEYTDERGYVPVEWWIMSLTEASNDLPKDHEGITSLITHDGNTVLLTDAVEAAGSELFGPYLHRWPLTKVLDIGGDPVVPSYGGEAEVPPIPFHMHSGDAVKGHITPPGKLEAYFFPPVDVPPYNRDLGRVVTRLGVKPETTKEDVIEAMRAFAQSDQLYAYGVEFEITPYDGWIVYPGCLHAPGPWPTFEIQLPQDDFHFAAWQLGVRAEGEELESLRKNFLLNGLENEEDVFTQAVDWELSTDPDFERKYRRPSRVLESGPWGRRLQIFFDVFYGEGFEVEPGQQFTFEAGPRPFAGIVWSGEGTLNGLPLSAVDAKTPKEFLVVPGHDASFVNTGDTTLRIYTVFPMK